MPSAERAYVSSGTKHLSLTTDRVAPEHGQVQSRCAVGDAPRRVEAQLLAPQAITEGPVTMHQMAPGGELSVTVGAVSNSGEAVSAGAGAEVYGDRTTAARKRCA